MGLDVYVGPLSRYYAGNRETIVQQAAKQAGVPVRIVRSNVPNRGWLGGLIERLRPRGPAAAQEAVRRWRERLRRETGILDLDWNDDPESEYETDKPAWDCYGALVLWAAYGDLPNAKRRETAEGWDKDPAYLTARLNPNSRCRHLVADTEIWLPVEFDAPLETNAISGQKVVVGSSCRLLEELRNLNSRTWRAGDSQISEWRYDGAKHAAPLEVSARFAFSIFYALAQRSVAARFPMKLDY
jgi:hypothetical protein